MTRDIDSLLQEDRVFHPTASMSARAHISSLAQYEELYQASITDPAAFWNAQATAELEWFQPWTEVMRHDFARIGTSSDPYVEFFVGGKLNVAHNCIDRHVIAGRGHKPAILWQGEAETDTQTITYAQLQHDVSALAHVLTRHGVTRGSRVTIYLPMIPTLPMAMLACARIGAVHSVVFSAFSATALGDRIRDCASDVVITADVGFHGGKSVPLKTKTDEAVRECPHVRHVFVMQRGDGAVPMQAGRDVWLHEALKDPACGDAYPAAEMDAEDPLFILYTSGSTGKPKGVLHTSGGYLLYAHLTAKYVFDLHEDDVYWCTADAGWITGHSYLAYGPLSNGATVLMFEGVPTYPSPDRFWHIIDQYQVTVFYTAPTALRALLRLGDTWPNKHNLSSIRVLGTVGEPINPEAWMWYHRVIGKERCPIVDTWWQTETGGIMITPLPGAMSTKPGSACKPFFGIVPQVLREDGTPADVNEGGSLVITQPWPGMIRGVYGDETHARIKEVYFSKYPQQYFTGDGCRVDSDGCYWLMGRMDDVINISGHRIGTAEIESALVAHAAVAEAAVVGCPHEIKGQGIYCFVTLKQDHVDSNELRHALVAHVRTVIGPIATPEYIQFTDALPKTRSGKIMRRILRKIAAGQVDDLGDTTTLADPSIAQTLAAGRV
jgi:acetyl-CoA synthetase